MPFPHRHARTSKLNRHFRPPPATSSPPPHLLLHLLLLFFLRAVADRRRRWQRRWRRTHARTHARLFRLSFSHLPPTAVGSSRTPSATLQWHRVLRLAVAQFLSPLLDILVKGPRRSRSRVVDGPLVTRPAPSFLYRAADSVWPAAAYRRCCSAAGEAAVPRPRVNKKSEDEAPWVARLLGHLCAFASTPVHTQT
jgi:hypothetical protein